jgi:hypothetical protein
MMRNQRLSDREVMSVHDAIRLVGLTARDHWHNQAVIVPKLQQIGLMFAEYLMLMSSLLQHCVQHQPDEEYITVLCRRIQGLSGNFTEKGGDLYAHLPWWNDSCTFVSEALNPFGQQWPATMQHIQCLCSDCLLSHLAFIAQWACLRHNITHGVVAKSLNDRNIPTKQGKTWHTSLNGLLQRPGRFSLSLYLAATNVGEFSRQWVNFQDLEPCFDRFVHTIAPAMFSSPDIFRRIEAVPPKDFVALVQHCANEAARQFLLARQQPI